MAMSILCKQVPLANEMHGNVFSSCLRQNLRVSSVLLWCQELGREVEAKEEQSETAIALLLDMYLITRL